MYGQVPRDSRLSVFTFDIIPFFFSFYGYLFLPFRDLLSRAFAAQLRLQYYVVPLNRMMWNGLKYCPLSAIDRVN